MELQLNSINKGQRVLLVDDFLATGGIHNYILKQYFMLIVRPYMSYVDIKFLNVSTLLNEKIKLG